MSGCEDRIIVWAVRGCGRVECVGCDGFEGSGCVDGLSDRVPVEVGGQFVEVQEATIVWVGVVSEQIMPLWVVEQGLIIGGGRHHLEGVVEDNIVLGGDFAGCCVEDERHNTKV